MDQVEVAGLRVAFERAGHGPLLVLLNGYVGDGPRTWRNQLDGLCDEFDVVAWDAPGSGRSSDPPQSFRLNDYADCLAGFVRALDLVRPHVAGLSFGGGVALELYRRHRDVPATLVLAGAYAGWAGSLPPEVVEQRLQQALELSELAPEHLVQALLPTMFSLSAPFEAQASFSAAASEFHPVGFRVMARSIAEADLRDVLPLIDVPTLLLYGDQDARAHSPSRTSCTRRSPGSELVVLRGVGHVSCIEAPAEFNRALRDFLHDRHGR